MIKLAEDSAVCLRTMVVQAEYNDDKDAYRELLSCNTVRDLAGSFEKQIFGLGN